MNKLKKWFILLTLLPIFIVFGSSLGIPAALVNFYTIFLLSMPFFYVFIFKKVKISLQKNFLVFFVSFILIVFNGLNSIDSLISFQYWSIFVLFIYGTSCWFKYLKVSDYVKLVDFFKKNVIYYLIISLVLMYVGIFFLGLGNLKTYNSFGIISGSALVYFWFVHNKSKLVKGGIIFLLFYFLFISLSRSSAILVVVTILIIEFIIVKSTKRRLLLITFGIVMLVFFNNKIVEWISQKETVVEFSSLSDIQAIGKDRVDLIDNFLRVYKNEFFLGYGVNTDYYSLSDWDYVNNIGVHNGILDMVLTIGVPLSIIIIYLVVISLKNLFILVKFDKTFVPLFAFTIYCTLRSYGESYFVLNIGNVMSLVFILILILTHNINSKKLVQILSEKNE